MGNFFNYLFNFFFYLFFYFFCLFKLKEDVIFFNYYLFNNLCIKEKVIFKLKIKINPIVILLL